MKRFLIIIQLEVKRAMKALPLMIAEAVFLCIFFAVMLLLCQKLFFGDTMLQKIPLGVVVEEENSMTRLALSYLEGMESTSNACEFQYMTLQEGMEALENDRLAALIVLPAEMVEAILDSRNYPVRVYFPKDSTLGALLIRELTEAGAGMLSMAQAEVYAIYDMCLQYDRMEELPVMEEAINRFNMSFALARERLIRQETLTITGDIPLPLHYAASGITLFLLLWGIACGKFLKGDNQAFTRQLRRSGINRGKWLLAKLIGTWCVLGIGASGILAGIRLVQGRLSVIAIDISVTWAVLPAMTVVLACIAALLLCCYQTAPTRSSGMVLLFIVTIVMVFISGGFIPTAFLPEALADFSRLLPCGAMLNIIAGVLGADLEGTDIWPSLCLLGIWAVMLYTVSVMIHAWKGEKDQ